jgi:hypothetical protein
MVCESIDFAPPSMCHQMHADLANNTLLHVSFQSFCDYGHICMIIIASSLSIRSFFSSLEHGDLISSADDTKNSILLLLDDWKMKAIQSSEYRYNSPYNIRPTGNRSASKQEIEISLKYHEAIFALFQAPRSPGIADRNFQTCNQSSKSRTVLLHSARSVLSLLSSSDSVNIFQSW